MGSFSLQRRQGFIPAISVFILFLASIVSSAGTMKWELTLQIRILDGPSQSVDKGRKTDDEENLDE